MSLWQRYYHWLHGQWPAGTVEPLPEVGTDGRTTVSGVRVVGDLAGVPLLKFAIDSAVAAVRAEAAELSAKNVSPAFPQIAIIGGGVAGISAALEAQRLGLRAVIYEATRPFNTVANYPAGKPIFTYPVDMQPRGGLRLDGNCESKESLLAELERQRSEAGIQTQQARVHSMRRSGDCFTLLDEEGQTLGMASRVILAIGRTGDFRSLGAPGEQLPHVSNRLLDAKDSMGQRVLVVGGGDSAVEAAIALLHAGAEVTLAHRGKEFSRAKPDNLEELNRLEKKASLTVLLETQVEEIFADKTQLKSAAGGQVLVPATQVFVLIGREAPLAFLRRVGIRIRGDWRWQERLSLAAMLLFALWLYHWKAWLIPALGVEPAALWSWVKVEPGSFLQTLTRSASERGFYYSLGYCLAVSWFGWRRVQRRKTPYVRRQTWVLALIQWLPLFLLPELLLPWAGRNSFFTQGVMQWLADQFFPSTDGIGLEREYWRAYGFVLAWPLFVYNWFTEQPLWGWLIVGSVQTFLLVPWMVRRWGKGAYCGWICSCGALAETMGDAHRQKMPHGSGWNKANMLGQVFLGFAALLMGLQIASWCGVIWAKEMFSFLFKGLPVEGSGLPLLNYKYLVDLLWAGVIGIACYFHYSGRVWCRIACPLAALMHLYARFSRFRIFAEKAKCISCNVCTSVCHQGIDVMAFASRGQPMEDPQCVRCSACVQQCPTGVLKFGRLEPGQRIVLDELPASVLHLTKHSS